MNGNVSTETPADRLIKKNNDALGDKEKILISIPELDRRDIYVHRNVFNPLLTNVSTLFGKNIPKIVRPNDVVLDVGGGTGYLSWIALSHGAKSAVALDISPLAIANMQENARHLGYENQFEVRLSDIFSALREDEKFSLIVFNAPLLEGNPRTPLEQAIYDPNYQTIQRFINEARKHLTEDGRIAITASSKNTHLRELIESAGYQLRLVDQKDVGYEVYSILEIVPQKTIAEIKHKIDNLPGHALILAAGPSGSGKTTTGEYFERTYTHNGRRVIRILADDYPTEHRPSRMGMVDYDDIRSYDQQAIQRDIKLLLDGKEVLLPPPYWNPTGERKRTQLRSEDVLWVDGLHVLHSQFIQGLPAQVRTLKLFMDAPWQLRFMRNISQNKYKNHDLWMILKRWMLVREDEKEFVLSTQGNADISLDSESLKDILELEEKTKELRRQMKEFVTQVPDKDEFKKQAEIILEEVENYCLLARANFVTSSVSQRNLSIINGVESRSSVASLAAQPVHTKEVVEDKAALAKGGIDFNIDKMNVQIKNAATNPR